jgi:hypothetical protein
MVDMRKGEKANGVFENEAGLLFNQTRTAVMISGLTPLVSLRRLHRKHLRTSESAEDIQEIPRCPWRVVRLRSKMSFRGK